MLALQPAIAVYLGNQRSVTKFTEHLLNAVMPHVVSLQESKKLSCNRWRGDVNIMYGRSVDLTVVSGAVK
jgi:hypothetical protein